MILEAVLYIVSIFLLFLLLGGTIVRIIDLVKNKNPDNAGAIIILALIMVISIGVNVLMFIRTDQGKKFDNSDGDKIEMSAEGSIPLNIIISKERMEKSLKEGSVIPVEIPTKDGIQIINLKIE